MEPFELFKSWILAGLDLASLESRGRSLNDFYLKGYFLERYQSLLQLFTRAQEDHFQNESHFRAFANEVDFLRTIVQTSQNETPYHRVTLKCIKALIMYPDIEKVLKHQTHRDNLQDFLHRVTVKLDPQPQNDAKAVALVVLDLIKNC